MSRERNRMFASATSTAPGAPEPALPRGVVPAPRALDPAAPALPRGVVPAPRAPEPAAPALPPVAAPLAPARPASLRAAPRAWRPWWIDGIEAATSRTA